MGNYRQPLTDFMKVAIASYSSYVMGWGISYNCITIDKADTSYKLWLDLRKAGFHAHNSMLEWTPYPFRNLYSCVHMVATLNPSKLLPLQSILYTSW